ncbi:MAG: aspartate dehydrogenase, partial [Caldimonas sp.]
MLSVAMVGCGAIGAGVLELLHGDREVRIDAVIVGESGREQAQIAVDRWASHARVIERLDGTAPDLLVECAGHAAIEEHVLPALGQGIVCVVASVGALSEPGLARRLEEAARRGGTQVQLLAGAIGAIDA